jgi:hypothetical protein
LPYVIASFTQNIEGGEKRNKIGRLVNHCKILAIKEKYKHKKTKREEGGEKSNKIGRLVSHCKILAIKEKYKYYLA